MPEAPEVSRVIAYLRRELTGHQIVRAEITHPKLVGNMYCETFCTELENQHFRRFERLGKYLIFVLDDYDWIAHLRMEGKFLIYDSPETVDQLDPVKDLKHIHARFYLEDGRVLCYKDTRKFGRMSLWPKQENIYELPPLIKIGKDVLDPSLDAAYLAKKAANRKIPLKTFLLDQSVIAGIGNIYADEILFEAGLSPLSVSCNLEPEDFEAIVRATRSIMERAIEAGGTTIRSFSYGSNHTGKYQNKLKVHRKRGKCPECGHQIQRQKVNERTTYFCPQCQKEK